MVFVLALVLAVPLGLPLIVRRFGLGIPGQTRGVGRLQVVSRVSLDPKHSIVLISRDAKEQLLLLGPNGPTILEDTVRLSRADRARMAATMREQEERREALQQQLLLARSQVKSGLDRILILGARLRASRPPDFAGLVAKSKPRLTAKAPIGRPARARPRKRTAA